MEAHIWRKAVQYTLALQRTPMSRREAGVLYRSCFLPAITYPFPATWLPVTFLERIHKLSTSTILNKMGYHRTLPRSLVFAPCRFGGIRLWNLHYEQGAQQVIIMLQHLQAGTPLSQTLEILIRTYQIWAGLREHVLIDTRQCPWIPDRWLSAVRATMKAQGLQICYNAWTVPALRQHDRFLMEDFLDYGIPRHHLEKLNACRMYLNVTTLAEITDHTGATLLPQVLSSYTNPIPKGLTNISTSRLQWPTVQIPGATCWQYWTKMLRTLYTGSAKGTNLRQPLGNWTPEYSKYRFWHWQLYDPDHLTFCASPTAPTRMALLIFRCRTSAKFSPTIPTNIPFVGPPVTPVDPTTGQINLPVTPCDAAPTTTIVRGPYKTLQQQFRDSLTTWQQPLFGLLRKARSTNALHQRLRSNLPIILVSDASVQKDGQSGFAWIIAHEQRQLWRGQGLAPGSVEDTHSGRAEAFGLLAALTFLSYYLSCYDPVQDTATVQCFCNNIGVITNIESIQAATSIRPNDTTANDRNLIVAIAGQINQCLPLQLQFLYVKGHQDTKADRPLTLAEQYNVECDRLAKEYV